MDKSAFAKLKSSSIDNTKKLMESLNKQGSYSNEIDDLLYKPEVDKSGNGGAIIRFLPQIDGEDSPFVKLYSHGFKVNSKWYIQNCPTTIGGSCPVCSENSEYYNSGIDSQKAIASSRSRKLSYYANIIVISDPKNPENEYSKSGKVFLFRFTKQVMDIINSCINPEFEGDVEFNPFDFWKGANFRYKITSKQTGSTKFPNYESSKFDSPSSLLGGDENQLMDLWAKQHKLQPIVAPNKFLTHEELSRKFYDVVGKATPVSTRVDEDVDFLDNISSHTSSTSSAVEEDLDDLLKDFE